MSVLHVNDPGTLTLVQDRGRPGQAHLGVSTSGAFDRQAHLLANRLVGNDADAATLEHLLGGLRIELPAGTWFAVTGAWGPLDLVARDGQRRRVDHSTATLVETAAELRIGMLLHGLRATIAVRGGVATPPELGSRSTDTLAGLGGRALTAGQDLPLGPTPRDAVPAADLVPVSRPTDGVVELGVLAGPRHDWFALDSHETLLATDWVASTRSDRTGVRLDGPALRRTPETEHQELASEGMLRGSIQVSPDGAPTILGPDHPVTGGYPVIAVVVDAHGDRLAQLRPGQVVRFHRATARR